MKYLFILLFLQGCGVKLKQTIDPEFIYYVNHYEDTKYRLTGDYINYPISVVFGTRRHAKEIARCDIRSYTTGEKRYTIIVDKKQWEKYNSEFLRLWVIYHEMGHCDLDLPHFDSHKDIMNSSISMAKDWNEWNILVQELFIGE